MSRVRGLGVALAVAMSSAARGDDWLHGTFEFGGSAAQLAEIDAQVEGAIEDMGFYLRPIARHRLQKLTKPAERFQFVPYEGGVKVVNELVTRPCSFDGSRTTFINRLGKQTQAVCVRSERGIREDFIGADAGTWSHTFTLSADGQTLEQRVKVTAPMLGRPLVYTLTYQRSDA